MLDRDWHHLRRWIKLYKRLLVVLGAASHLVRLAFDGWLCQKILGLVGLLPLLGVDGRIRRLGSNLLFLVDVFKSSVGVIFVGI